MPAVAPLLGPWRGVMHFSGPFHLRSNRSKGQTGSGAGPSSDQPHEGCATNHIPIPRPEGGLQRDRCRYGEMRVAAAQPPPPTSLYACRALCYPSPVTSNPGLKGAGNARQALLLFAGGNRRHDGMAEWREVRRGPRGDDVPINHCRGILERNGESGWQHWGYELKGRRVRDVNSAVGFRKPLAVDSANAHEVMSIRVNRQSGRGG